MSVAWQFVVAGIGTYLIRISAIALVGRGLTIRPEVERTLRLIAPSILASIIVSGLVLDQDRVNARPSWLIGAAAAALIVRRYRSAGWAMGVGMVVVYLLQQLGFR
jgi:branched-subunit amino acid transport protein